jgi:hypothetical protein
MVGDAGARVNRNVSRCADDCSWRRAAGGARLEPGGGGGELVMRPSCGRTSVDDAGVDFAAAHSTYR